MSNILDPTQLIQTGGIALVGILIFAESGLLIGFFLPGDTLLLSAGFFAGSGKLNLVLLLIVVYIAAVLGDNVGYSIGKRTGHRIFKSDSSVLFHKDYLTRAEQFYERHGGKTVVLARFIPIVRTFAPMAAGMAKMERKQFVVYNCIGAGLWGVGVTMIGYALARILGEYVDLEKYLLAAVVFAVAISFGGSLFHLLKDKQTRDELFTRLLSPIKRRK